MNVELIMRRLDGRTRAFPLGQERVFLGRDSRCDVRIPLPSIAPRQCEIELRQEQLILRNLGPTRCTRVNGSDIDAIELHEGDEVDIGPVHFTVRCR